MKAVTPKRKSPGARYPWGISHVHRFQRLSLTSGEKNAYLVSCVYTIRLKLPKYVHILYNDRVVPEAAILAAFSVMNKAFDNIRGAEYKIKGLTFRSPLESNEIVVQVTDGDKYEEEKAKKFLRIVKDLLRDSLELIRILVVDNISNPALAAYKYKNVEGLLTIRYVPSRRPKEKGSKIS